MRIAHLSDTQIRNFQRHAEFRESYEYLYASLREKKPDFIVVVGDIAHSKTHISPEFVQLVVEYFSKLSNIAQLIIVPGNHDGNLNNLSRLDALTPIIKAMNNPKITYYKNSGVYSWRDGVNFVNFSCFDEDNWPTKDHPLVNTDMINVGLYHGMVKGAILQNGVIVEDCQFTTDQFLEIVDYLLMGDIHKTQFLDFKQKAAYCGSFPQQNFGESIKKGYLLWDIEGPDKHEVDFVRLPNVCPYYIIDMPDDLLLTEDLPIQEGARIRIDSRQLTPVEKNTLRKNVEKKYVPKEIYFQDDVSAHKQDVKIVKNIKIEDLSDVAVQEKLIRKFLEHLNLEESMLDAVCDLNKKLDSEIRQHEEVIRNVQYKILKTEWDNILSYGEGNSFDFTKRKGLVGIFGKNAVGKSSLAVDIPLYIMFNANSKSVVKNDHLINDNKDSCSAKMDIQLGDDIYRLERSTWTYLKSGKRKGTPVFQGKTKLVFTKFDKDGNVIQLLDDEKRQDTDKEVRKIFGTAEDAMATSITSQFDLLNFINKKDTERQKIIGRYFDVDMFEKKREIAAKDASELKGQLKIFDDRDFEVEKEDLVAALKVLDKGITDLNGQIVWFDEQVSDIDEVIRKASEKILKVSLDETMTEQTYATQIQAKKVDCINKRNEIDNLEFSREKLEQRLEQLLESIDEVNIDKLQKELKKWEKKAGDPDVSKVWLYESLIESRDESLAKLQKYKCITNADCCMLEEVTRVKEEKETAVSENASLLYEIRIFRDISTKHLEPLEEKISEYFSDIDTSLDLTKRIKIQDKLLKTQKELIEKMIVEVHDLAAQLRVFIENKNQIDQNNKHRQRINDLKDERLDFSREIDHAKEDAVRLEFERDNLWEKHTQIEEDQKTYAELKDEYDVYFYFLETAGKNGLSRIIINDNLDIINVEIEKILSGKVNFIVEVKANEAGKIDIYFKAPKGKLRRIELCCGMEKTISAICIRAALVSVTTLPRSNIFVLDEVFTALDPEYLDATRKILQYLKNLFDSVIIITHIEGFKDLVDHVVEVYRDDQGYARIV